MISIQYAITKEDYINYYTYVMWDAPENRRKRNYYYIRQLIPIALFVIAFYYTGIFDRSSKFILLILGFLVITSLLSLFGVRSNMAKQAEKVTDNPANSAIFLEVSMIVSETGISTKDTLTETKFQWKAFIKKQESDEYYFLFINAIQALIIPKRIFNNPAEKMEFEKLLSHHLSFDADLGHLVKS